MKNLSRIAYALAVVGLCATTAAGACLPIEEAAKRIGETACVTGKVLKVGRSSNSNFFLDFCADYRSCPFTVFVPAKDVQKVGDVRQLEGKVIEVQGKIKRYGGRAEIVLSDAKQLQGEAAKLPPVPKEFDVEHEGTDSAGRFSEPKERRPRHHRTRNAPAPD